MMNSEITEMLLLNVLMTLNHEHNLNSPTLSVVIPCYNEERYVGSLLNDLEQQTEQPAQVVVADCMSEDDTAAVAQEFVDRMPLSVVRSMERSPAAARNTGVAAVTCKPEDYLVFIDADVRLPDTFLERVRRAITEHPTADFVTPAFQSDGLHFLDSFVARSVNRVNQRTIERRKRVAGIGGVMVVRKAIHDKTGGFPADIAQDDIGYVARLNKQHATAYYAGNIWVTNSSRRVRRDGALKFVLSFIPDVPFAKGMVERLRGKRYGHYKDVS